MTMENLITNILDGPGFGRIRVQAEMYARAKMELARKRFDQQTVGLGIAEIELDNCRRFLSEMVGRHFTHLEADEFASHLVYGKSLFPARS